MSILFQKDNTTTWQNKRYTHVYQTSKFSLNDAGISGRVEWKSYIVICAMKDSSVYTLTAATYMSCLRLERFRQGLVAHVSPEEAWYVVEEGIKMLVSAFLDMSCGYQHEL